MMRAFFKTAILVLMLATSALRAETASVARVALTVGDATRVNAAGVAEPLRLGTQLAAGDRIITGKDAIAILVFADEGRVSLRSASELVIRRYDVDPSGADTRMELELVRGAMRQISGNASRLQPERYRLNTPVAAIGVRGTDFLAKTSDTAIETFVQEGMIVVLPRGNGCADGAASGACAPIASLSSSDAGQYLRVVSTGQVERRSINSEEIERLFGIRLSSAGAGAGSAGSVAPGVVFVAGANAQVFNSLNGRDEWQGGKSGVQSGELAELAAAAAATMAQAAPPALAALPSQLVWGRFSDADSLPIQLPLPYDQAREGRHVTVGELGQYALWRENPSGRLDPALRGQVQFNLAAASAVFVQPSGVSAADVRGASLVVDFDKSAFGAGVTVDHVPTQATASFSVNGRINDEGVFWAGDAAQRVAGALSRDGTEAGYLFTKEHALGTFKGVTLWNAR